MKRNEKKEKKEKKDSEVLKIVGYKSKCLRNQKMSLDGNTGGPL